MYNFVPEIDTFVNTILFREQCAHLRREMYNVVPRRGHTSKLVRRFETFEGNSVPCYRYNELAISIVMKFSVGRCQLGNVRRI